MQVVEMMPHRDMFILSRTEVMYGLPNSAISDDFEWTSRSFHPLQIFSVLQHWTIRVADGMIISQTTHRVKWRHSNLWSRYDLYVVGHDFVLCEFNIMATRIAGLDRNGGIMVTVTLCIVSDDHAGVAQNHQDSLECDI